MKMTLNALALALATTAMVPAGAQTMGAAPTMDHSMMGGGSMQAGSSAPDVKKPMQGMDHGSMGASPTKSPTEEMPGMKSGTKPTSQPAAMDAGMAGMEEGGMQSQGGTAPADARDPNGYSGGYTLEAGPYALPGTRQLRLADEHNFGSIMFNRLERGFGSKSNSTAYDTQAWFGRDYDRLVIKAEGDVAQGKLQEARTEILWGHAVAPFWDAQVGLRYDSGGTEPDRKWLALGVQGLAPYWFEVDAAAYIGDNGRTAFRLGGEYEILLTQKLILQPRAELNFYGQDDAAREIGRGLANGVAGIRLRYEINRQFAPYIGVERSSKFGKTADMARASSVSTGDTRWVAGVRFWF